MDFRRDLFAYFRADFRPVVLDSRHLIITPSRAEILAEANDLWYEIVEQPVAFDRMADDGCPNC